jgi:hypothetical protein
MRSGNVLDRPFQILDYLTIVIATVEQRMADADAAIEPADHELFKVLVRDKRQGDDRHAESTLCEFFGTGPTTGFGDKAE